MTLAYQEYYTVKDYNQWDNAWELIEGMPYAMSPSPTVTHQTVATNINFELKNSVIKNNVNTCDDCIILMETDWQISNDTIVRPDVMVVCKAIDEKVLVSPDLIFEVVSKSSTKRDETMKFELYQREGVMYYALVYPEKHLVKVYLNEANGFKKLQDFTSGKANFPVRECLLSVNIDQIWR